MRRSMRLPREWMVRALVHLTWALPVVLAASAMLAPIGRQIDPGYQTTRITAPLRADQTIDYLSAIDEHFQAGVTPENNAAVLILQAMGSAALAPEQCDAITDRLGIPPLTAKGNLYLTHVAFCYERGLPLEFDPRDARGRIVFPLHVGTSTTHWLAYLADSMKLITEASKRSRFFIPLNGGRACRNATQVERPYVDLLREIDRAFVTRAMLRLQDGDFRGFHDDVMTLHRLARLLGQAPTPVERVLVGAMTLETAACEIERAAAESGRLSATEAKQMMTELAALGEMQSIDEALDIGERYLWLDILQVLAHSSPIEAEKIVEKLGNEVPMMNPLYNYWPIPLSFPETMRAVNQKDDEALAALRSPTYRQRIEKLQAGSADWADQALLNPIAQVEDYFESARMQNRLTQISLGLAAYKADHKEYPITLGAMTPDYLAKVPDDIFTNRPPVYAPTDNGYTLYSLGPNMKDDGGKGGRPADDIIASLP